MGAINQAFNQAAGAVAGAALAIKHAKETEESKAITAENTALVARNQSRTADTEYDAAKVENEWTPDEKGNMYHSFVKSIKAENDIDKATNALIKAEQRKNASQKTIQKKINDLAAAVSARDKLKAKIEAIENMRVRAQEQRDAADKATQLAEKAKQKYQSRWGGK